MIVDIIQITNNRGFKYDIYHDGLICRTAQCPRIIKENPLQLFDFNKELLFKTKYDLRTNIMNVIPFKWLWSKKLSRVYEILDKDDQSVGRIMNVTEGFAFSYHKIEWNNDKLILFQIKLGKRLYITVMLNDIQIAMIVKDFKVINNLDVYKLYLLDNYSQYLTALELFVLYYDNHYHSNRNEVVLYKKDISVQYSYSKTDKFFNSNWLNNYFGLEPIEYNKIRNNGILLIIILFLLFILIFVLFYH